MKTVTINIQCEVSKSTIDKIRESDAGKYLDRVSTNRKVRHYESILGCEHDRIEHLRETVLKFTFPVETDAVGRYRCPTHLVRYLDPFICRAFQEGEKLI